MQKNLFRKGLVVGIIVIFLGVSIASSTSKTDLETNPSTGFSGNLIGYVNDTSGNPIKGAIIRVFYHDTWKKDYSDQNGFYNVTKIPICYCIKEAYCSKIGYKTEHVSIAIVENTVHDFILISIEEISKGYNPMLLSLLKQFPVLFHIFQRLELQ
jgi:hypothetical protein